MQCPYCGHNDSKVIDSRDATDFNATRRRRECLKCQKRFTTYERVEEVELWVVKKGGRRERFDPSKIRSGIEKACEKRPVSHDKIERVVAEIERELRAREGTEVKSKVIGEFVMEKLKELDKVAYIRFASVYRQFADVSTFQKELRKLLK